MYTKVHIVVSIHIILLIVDYSEIKSMLENISATVNEQDHKSTNTIKQPVCYFCMQQC